MRLSGEREVQAEEQRGPRPDGMRVLEKTGKQRQQFTHQDGWGSGGHYGWATQTSSVAALVTVAIWSTNKWLGQLGGWVKHQPSRHRDHRERSRKTEPMPRLG